MARVELGRRDHWKSVGRGETRELSVISATLEGIAVKRGLKYVPYLEYECVSRCSYCPSGLVLRFPISAALISAVIYLAVSVVTVAACILPIMGRRMDESKPHASDSLLYRGRIQSDVTPAVRPPTANIYSDSEEKPRKKRRRIRPLSIDDTEGVASEVGS
jgi:hypothetical protein